MGTGDLLNIQPTELKVQCKSFLKLILSCYFLFGSLENFGKSKREKFGCHVLCSFSLIGVPRNEFSELLPLSNWLPKNM
jgi:hypothetical protein